MYLYLIHFDDPFWHAQHYCGLTDNPGQRLRAHARGRGANLTRVLWDQELAWRLAALFRTRECEHTPRTLERLAKRQNGLAKYCPICNPETHTTPAGTIDIDVNLLPFPLDSRSLRTC